MIFEIFINIGKNILRKIFNWSFGKSLTEKIFSRIKLKISIAHIQKLVCENYRSSIIGIVWKIKYLKIDIFKIRDGV